MKKLLRLVFLIIGLASFSFVLFAKTASHAVNINEINEGLHFDPFYLLFFLIGITLLPFLAVMSTSFAKIVVVLSIARQAIGTTQTPPNIVIMSLAMVLTCFAMHPVMMAIYDSISQNALKNTKGWDAILEIGTKIDEPLRAFLSRHAKIEDKELFFSLIKEKPGTINENVDINDFIILAPAFLISELALAFQIGFLIYLPFLVIDMTVANLLMALGMQMLAPTTISLPFKILLFVLIDGFRLISEGLVKV